MGVLNLLEESLWVVVGVDVDLGQGVVGGRLVGALVDTGLQPGQDQLQPVAAVVTFRYGGLLGL